MCAEPGLRECYKITDEACVTGIEKIHIECLHADDRPECAAALFRTRFASAKSKDCEIK